MNLALLFRQQLQNAGDLGAATLRNLESVISALTAWRSVEHNEDGTHGALTATSASVGGLLAADRYQAKKLLIWDYATDASGVIKGTGINGVSAVDAGLIVHVDRTVGAGGIARSIHAIDATGRQPGEIVWFVCVDVNTAPGGVNFVQISNSGNRQGFPGFANYTGVFSDPVNLQANRVIPLMYLPNSAVAEAAGWPSHPWYIGHP